MGVAEVVGFAVCWLVVAALMLWGVFTEKKRGPTRFEPPAGAAGAWHPSGSGRAIPTEWVVIEEAEGATPEIAIEVRFLASAWLAARGIDLSTVPSADVRTEVTTTGDGASTTRVLVRAASLQSSRHRN